MYLQSFSKTKDDSIVITISGPDLNGFGNSKKEGLMASRKRSSSLYTDLSKVRDQKFVRITEKSFQMNVKTNQMLMKNRIRNSVLEVLSTMTLDQIIASEIFPTCSQ